MDTENKKYKRNFKLKPGKYIQLSVEDNGCGIPPDELDQIFDPYFTTKQVGEGSGIGLAVVKGIVRNHDGIISVRSEPGKGTMFDIFFPEAEGRIQEDVSDVFQIKTGEENILIVDDEEQVVKMEGMMLSRMGYRITDRTSSPEALKLFSEQPDSFDLVISDIIMPHMSGEQFAKALLEIRPDIPIILCTGNYDNITKDKMQAMGVKALVSKPVEKSEFLKIIRDVLDTSAK